MKILYIIPARGGSKGIPGKNIRRFAGSPLIAHAISQALELARTEDVCVTTDSEEIAAISAEAGAEIRFLRPSELATDTASSQDVMIHALNFYENLNGDYDAVVLLQPTSPLRTLSDIKRCVSRFIEAGGAEGKIDMAVSVKEADANPYYNAFETGPEGYLHLSKGEGGYTRRQDVPKVWQYTGAVYVINPQSLRDAPMSRFEKIVPVELPASHSADLDTETDWMIAEILYQKLNENE